MHDLLNNGFFWCAVLQVAILGLYFVTGPKR